MTRISLRLRWWVWPSWIWDREGVRHVNRGQPGTDGHEVRYPLMHDEDDPSHATWSPAIRREMADLDDGAIVAGHSVGATILINALAEQPPECALEAIVLIAAPFVGEGAVTWDRRPDFCQFGGWCRRRPVVFE